MANELMPTGSRALANDAAIGDEIAQAGAGFGELVLRTGEAVAATQNQLNETGAQTASALATTVVDVIAVQEKVYRDDGTLDTSRSHVRQLPLITFIDPVFYQWSSVRLQGLFYASEFSASSTSDSYTHSDETGYGQAGIGLIFGLGYNQFNYSSDRIHRETTTDTDLSYGRVRMNALLEPRDDVGIPKPNQVIRGPRLTLIQGEILDVLDGADLTGRTMSLLIQYNRRNGSAIPGKAVSVETNGLPWSYADGPAAVTDANGQVEIQLRRDFIDEDAETTPADFIVTARVGLVSNSITVTF